MPTKEKFGNRYGMLTLIKRVKNRGRNVYWEVKCDCGTVKESSIGNIKAGKIVSCGCKNRNDYKSMIGQVFGRLVVNGVGKVVDSKQYLICEGDDGREVEVMYTHLVSGDIISNGDVKDGNKNPNWKGYKDIGARWFTRVTRGANIRGLECTINIKDVYNLYIRQNKRCALTGALIQFGDSRYSINTASLDRKDNNIGYTLNNVQLVHTTINMFKNKFDNEEFLLICNAVSDFSKGVITNDIKIPHYYKNGWGKSTT